MDAQDKQIEANRLNAQHSTGPKSEVGKSTSSQNAVKHGVLSRIPVLPLVESQTEWDGHLERLQSCLAPAGCLETVLVEKVALQLWRLKRLALYEREVTAVRLESIGESESKEESELDDDWFNVRADNSISGARQTVKRVGTELRFVIGLQGQDENEAVDSGLAAQLIESIAEDLNVDIYDDEAIEFPDYPDGADLDSIEWTAGHLRTCLGVICDHVGGNLDTVLAKREAKCRNKLATAKVRVKSLELEADRKRRQRIVPNGLEVEKITRYEAHLERSLYRALHELQRLQAGRRGQAVAPLKPLTLTWRSPFLPNDLGK